MRVYLGVLSGLYVANYLNENVDMFSGLSQFTYRRSTCRHLRFQVVAYLPEKTNFLFYLEQNNLRYWEFHFGCSQFTRLSSPQKYEVKTRFIQYVEPVFKTLPITSTQLLQNILVDTLNRSSDLIKCMENQPPSSVFTSPPYFSFNPEPIENPLIIPIAANWSGQRGVKFTEVSQPGYFSLDRLNKPFKCNWFRPKTTKDDLAMVKNVIVNEYENLSAVHNANKADNYKTRKPKPKKRQRP